MSFRWIFSVVMVSAIVAMLIIPTGSAVVQAQAPVTQNSELSDAPVDAGGAGGRFLAAVSGHIQDITELLSEAGQGLLLVPELVRELFVRAQDPETLATWGEMSGKVLLVLVAGIVGGWIASRLLGGLRSRARDRESDAVWARAFLLVLRTIIDIVPVVVFAAVAYAVLPLTDPRHETRLIVLTLVNAGVVARVILAVSRLVLTIDAPALRLLPVGDESVHYFYIWIRRVVLLGAYGYFILEAAFLMGIPAGLYTFLMKLLGLAVTAMLLILVMQNRNDVAAWLRRDREAAIESEITGEKSAEKQTIEPLQEKRIVSGFRRRFSDLWHIVAIVVIIGTFLTWALEVEGGMVFLVSGLAMTLVAAAVASLLLRLADHGVERLFHIAEDLKNNFPGLEARADRYKPFFRSTIRGVVYIIAVFSILEAWGLGALGWLFSPAGGLIIGELATLFLIIAGAFLLWEIVSAVIERSLAREAAEGGSTRKLTLLPLMKNIVRITLVVIASMLVLSQIGINIGPLLAGAGVIGLAVGFGAQTLVRDVITGAFILIEDAISVGDWVEAGGHSGTVERLTVRTLTLRDLAGTVHVIPFGDVTTVTNYNRDYGYALIDAGVAYRENYNDVVQALQDVAVSLRQDPTWGPDITGDLEVFGMNNLSDSAVEIRVRMKTRPMRQFAIRRVFLERMKRVFDERGIEIPFPHRTIWFGTGKDGTAPPMYLAKNGQVVVSDAGGSPSKARRVKNASESEASEGVVQDMEQSGPGEEAEAGSLNP